MGGQPLDTKYEQSRVSSTTITYTHYDPPKPLDSRGVPTEPAAFGQLETKHAKPGTLSIGVCCRHVVTTGTPTFQAGIPTICELAATPEPATVEDIQDNRQFRFVTTNDEVKQAVESLKKMRSDRSSTDEREGKIL